jgi:DMSO/TMAO reductase YedYZ heme-binding membrane subunit
MPCPRPSGPWLRRIFALLPSCAPAGIALRCCCTRWPSRWCSWLPAAAGLAGLWAFTDTLGANPAEALIRSTGDWTLRLLCLVLAVTPLRAWTGTPALARFRRMLGLFVYFYVVLHLLSYGWFDMGFDLADIMRDIIKRPFILVGFRALLLLTPLALTSFNRAIRRWARRWQRLHRLVYLVAALACCTSSGCARARTTSPRWRCMR